jgi:hypothetical protein
MQRNGNARRDESDDNLHNRPAFRLTAFVEVEYQIATTSPRGHPCADIDINFVALRKTRRIG